MFDAAGPSVQAAEGAQEVRVEAMRGGAARGRGQAEVVAQVFGQIGVRDLRGRAVQCLEEAEAPDEGDEFQAAEPDGAAAGAEDERGDFPQRVVRTSVLDGFEQAFPQAGMGEAAEVAGDGVGLAVFGREAAPGEGGGGEVEYGVDAGAEVADLAAGGGAGEEVGEEGVELGGGEGLGEH